MIFLPLREDRFFKTTFPDSICFFQYSHVNLNLDNNRFKHSFPSSNYGWSCMTLLKWNKEFALEQAADDLELLEELLDIFKTSLASDIELIANALDHSDTSLAAGAAHSIKGASSSLGIDGITEIAKSIEEDCKNGGLEQVKTLLPQLRQMLVEVENM